MFKMINVLVIFPAVMTSFLLSTKEEQADLLAATTLINSGNKNIVEQYINYLKNLNGSDKDTTWWHHINEQINYLEKILD